MTDFTLRVGETDLTVSAAGVDIARYAFDPDGPAGEGPKPFLHPLRALDGGPLTAYRPWDHRWHKGLQMTWTHVSGQNFWGGPTYRRETGYEPLENVGRMRHDGFTSTTDSGVEVSFSEELTWITQGGEAWVGETRTHRFHSPTSRAACGSSTSPRRCATCRAGSSSSAARRRWAARTRDTPAS